MSAATTYPTVREILRLSAFAGCRVLGGESGLRCPVQGANIGEVQDYARWLSPGELLITTGFALAEDPQALYQLLPTAQRCGLSGVCIKPGRYLPQTLPLELSDAADRLGIPLIELPAEVRFSDLTAAIAQEISRRQVPEERERRLTMIFHQLLDGKDDTGQEQAAIEIGLHLEQPYILLRIATEATAPDKRRIMREAEDIIHRLGALSWAVLFENEPLLLLQTQQDIFSFEQRLRQAFYAYAAAQSPACVCGISRPCVGAAELHLADEGARSALRLARQQAVPCLSDDPVGLLGLASGQRPKQEVYIRRQLKPLLDQAAPRRQELLETLDCWFRYGGNQRQMARSLHLHYNTVNYRLQQLWTLLQVDPTSYEARLSLELALYLYRIRWQDNETNGQ